MPDHSKEMKPHALLRRAAGVVVPCLMAAGLLAAAEGALRWSGFGVDQAPFLPEVSQGKTLWRLNKAYFEQFLSLPVDTISEWEYSEIVAEMPKPARVYRVFVFGESAAYGNPYVPFGVAAYLDALLSLAYPEVEFEVYNAACPGVNSHILQGLAAGCAELSPDAFVMYVGNNESSAPYRPSRLLGPWPPGLVRAHMDLMQLRLAQALLQTPVLAPMLTEPSDVTWDIEQGNSAVLAAYRANLKEMARLARDAGAEPVVCTIARYRATEELPAPSPEALADGSFERTFLGPSAVQAALDAEIPLADVEAAMILEAPEENSGPRFFDDRLHFTFAGSFVAARTVFELLSPMVAEKYGLTVPAVPPGRRDCERAMGLSHALEWRIMAPRYTGRPEERALFAPLERDAESLPPSAAAVVLRDAVLADPDDTNLRRLYIDELLRLEAWPAAERAARAFVQDFPYARGAWRRLGLALENGSKPGAARGAYEKALAQFPDDAESRKQLETLPPPAWTG
ncbi:MAG: tetratricopeptide repeat protein [Candidatus Hydrogenedens sp.]|nr:tetratricopeptide repeat protein [Candidatus Hydrogenedens sp.]